MVDVRGTASSVHYSITARPNCSLSPCGTFYVFLSLAVTTLLISCGFALIGAWPILAFAGAELLAVSLSFFHVCRHAGDYEQLSMDDDKVVLETHEPGLDRHIELNGYWVRVLLEYLPDGHCKRLALRSHGREVEFGRYLSSDERSDIGRQLKRRLGGFLS